MRYKVGDIVKIKENLKVGRYCSEEFLGKSLDFIPPMEQYKGMFGKIVEVFPENIVSPERYRLSIAPRLWTWTSEMLVMENSIAYYLYEREIKNVNKERR